MSTHVSGLSEWILDWRGTMKKRINITLEDDVLQKVDSYASENYTTRSGAITMLIVAAKGKRKAKNRDGGTDRE